MYYVYVKVIFVATHKYVKYVRGKCVHIYKYISIYIYTVIQSRILAAPLTKGLVAVTSRRKS